MSTTRAAAPTAQPAPSPAQPAPSPSPSPYLNPTSLYHPARLARAGLLALALLLGAALLTGGLGRPLEINGLIAPLDGMPATSPERTAAELDRDGAHGGGPLVPADDATRPQDLLLPEDAVAPSPLLPADAAPAVSPAAVPAAVPAQTDDATSPRPASPLPTPDQTDAYPTFARTRAMAHTAAAVNHATRSSDNRAHDGVRAGRPAAFPDGTPLLSRPSHRTGLPSTPREASPAPTPATDHLSPASPQSTPKPAPLPAIPPLWETSDLSTTA